MPCRCSHPSQVTGGLWTSLLTQLCISSITDPFLLNWCLGLYLLPLQTSKYSQSLSSAQTSYAHIGTDIFKYPGAHRAFWVSFYSRTSACTILTKISGEEKGINPGTISPSHLPFPTEGRSQCSQCPGGIHCPTARPCLLSPFRHHADNKLAGWTLKDENPNIEFFLCGRVP